jgi:hypothetical protein
LKLTVVTMALMVKDEMTKKVAKVATGQLPKLQHKALQKTLALLR